MRKLAILLTSLIFLFTCAATAWAADFEIDTSKSDQGLLTIKNITSTDKRMKLQVAKGTEKYVYDIRTDRTTDYYPLQMGDGTYKISVMENVADSRYKSINSADVDVKLKDPNAVYLNSVQNIYWTSSMVPIQHAKNILTGDKTAEEKVKTIYNDVIKNYSYDWDLYKNLPSTYLPNIESFYKVKKGICYDYSSLTASMLRSMGYPTRMVKGYNGNVEGLHAWNEVLLDGKWVVIDTTLDASAKSPSFSKNAADYKKIGQY